MVDEEVFSMWFVFGTVAIVSAVLNIVFLAPPGSLLSSDKDFLP